ncbi:acid protease [Schizophyllum commune Loenen D]|nr:acid protease [Schizophyllum commune Loenen D]
MRVAVPSTASEPRALQIAHGLNRFHAFAGHARPRVARRKRYSPPPTHILGLHNGTAHNFTGAGPVGVPSALNLFNVTDPSGPASRKDSLALSIEADDLGYLANVWMGTPPRQFRLLVDSGSADLWVPSEHCVSVAGEGCNHAYLGPSVSSSFVEMSSDEWSILYGSGFVNGRLVRDRVSVAGFGLNNMTFGVADMESSDFAMSDIPFDGILGLAGSRASRMDTPTFVEALSRAGLVSQPIVSYKLPRVADSKGDGEMTFGAMDPSKYDPLSVVSMRNLNSDGYWQVAMQDVHVDEGALGLKDRTGIVDTGTSLLVIPEEDATRINALLDGTKLDNQTWTIPCIVNHSLALSFGGRQFAIDPRDLVFPPSDASGRCISKVVSSGRAHPTLWLLGDVFLKNVYLSTNAATNEVKFARLA